MKNRINLEQLIFEIRNAESFDALKKVIASVDDQPSSESEIKPSLALLSETTVSYTRPGSSTYNWIETIYGFIISITAIVFIISTICLLCWIYQLDLLGSVHSAVWFFGSAIVMYSFDSLIKSRLDGPVEKVSESVPAGYRIISNETARQSQNWRSEQIQTGDLILDLQTGKWIDGTERIGAPIVLSSGVARNNNAISNYQDQVAAL